MLADIGLISVRRQLNAECGRYSRQDIVEVIRRNDIFQSHDLVASFFNGLTLGGIGTVPGRNLSHLGGAHRFTAKTGCGIFDNVDLVARSCERALVRSA
ncbi:hypothetical protein [Rhizobium sp. Leaf311]|uniref:hypothetical protein n=1 Tax=Rhizobium sp. Leaf311 TaxID=1736332 RepID=UPI001AECEFBE|nr:hypothetical protein [Rhizobium sp. Leaf311]